MLALLWRCWAFYTEPIHGHRLACKKSDRMLLEVAEYPLAI